VIENDDSMEVLVGVVRVLVVDDQEPFRNAMAAVVEVTDGFEVVGRGWHPARSHWWAAEELRSRLVTDGRSTCRESTVSRRPG
jgi:hypothetical protein